MKITKKATKSFVQSQLRTNPAWAVKAMVRIYNENQTAEEQAYHDTIVENGIGFSGTDAYILSSFAEQVNEKKLLSPKQMKIVHKKMPKYWSQVISMSDEVKLKEMVSEHLRKQDEGQLELKM